MSMYVHIYIDIYVCILNIRVELTEEWELRARPPAARPPARPHPAAHRHWK